MVVISRIPKRRGRPITLSSRETFPRSPSPSSKRLIFFSAISWDFEVIVTIRKQLFDILENPFVTYILYDNIRICLKFYETCAQVH